jgi:putative drug exporter of the RND superfamily
MAGIARWCFRHRYVVIGIWVAALISVVSLSQSLGSNLSNSFSLPKTDSSKALSLLKNVSSGAASGETDTIVWHVSNGSVRDAATEQHINAMLAKISAIPQVATITSPYTPMGVSQISKDGQIAYAQVSFTKNYQSLNKQNIKDVISTAEAARQTGLQVELGGEAIEQSQQTGTSSSELIGIVAAAVILFIAFGSLLAMTLPLITALVGLGVGISSITLLSHVISVSTFAPTLGLLIGLGVGIDYSLFIVTRHRNGLIAGLNPEEAAVKALNTAGRAVIFAGSTVCIALLGLLTLRISFLGGVGIAAALVVAIGVLAATTLLPALLGVYKMKVLSRRARRALKKDGPVTEEVTKGIWARNAQFVQNHSWTVAIAAMAIMLIIAIPFFSLRLGSSDASNDQAATTTRKSYALLAEGFGPGFNGPLQLVGAVNTPSEQTAYTKLAVEIKNQPGVAQVTVLPVSPQSKVGVMQVVPTTSPESKGTSQLIAHLRKVVIPAAESGTNLHVYVGGNTATFVDFAAVIESKLPLFLGVIIGLGFIILMLAFRSLLIPLTAAVMNLLAAGAAFGVVVAIFQWGWLSNLLNTGGPGPVEAFLPVIMVSILFGLSMDYQVFLVSRMHEEWTHTKDNHRSVRIGQAETGRVITAAATIMIFVFSSFVLGGQRVIAEFGIGLASAVFLDAFVVRNFLVPALMHRFGKANWYLPKWLDKILPHLAVEPTEEKKV